MALTRILAAVLLCAAAASAEAKVRTKPIEYRQDGTVLQGFLAWDDAAKGKRPGVLFVHEWWGNNAHVRDQAVRAAKAGYVGFALDLYGNGKVAKHPADAKAFVAEATKDPAVLTARFDTALGVLKAQPQVDAEKIAAFGYCFGGGVALAMARAGEDLDAVVTFHGALDPFFGPAKPGAVKAAILVNAGGADPMVPPEKVQAFEQEMKAAGANVKVISYPGAKHGFTNPDSGKYGVEGLAYDRDADRKSWDAAMAFLKQVFGT